MATFEKTRPKLTVKNTEVSINIEAGPPLMCYVSIPGAETVGHKVSDALSSQSTLVGELKKLAKYALEQAGFTEV